MNARKDLLILSFVGLTLSSCSYASGGNTQKEPAERGAKKEMKTYHLGRFAVDLPPEFRLAEQKQDFRLVEIEEIQVPGATKSSAQFAEETWRERMAEIKKLDKPKGVKEIVIKEGEFKELSRWCRGGLYYNDYMTVRRGTWEVWVDYGTHLTVFRLLGLISAEESMISWLMEVVRAYIPNITTAVPSPFCTNYGTIALPYKRQESTYARFEGPWGMVFEIEMNEVHKKAERKGIIDRTAAAIAAGFANGIDVKKIRSKKRTETGLTGDEEILQGEYQGDKNVSFDWEYSGEPESGEKPMIQVTMDTKSDNLTAKINMWDLILGSLRPSRK